MTLRQEGTDSTELQQQLRTHQGFAPLLALDVDARAVATVVADWTGIPLSSLLRDEQSDLLSMEQSLENRVVGQSPALCAIAQRLRAAKTGLTPENGPQGVFLLTGPSGTGKTETALTLADTLFGGEKSLITINLSEYQEPHTVSQLKGAPPGYVGYGQGGVLTEAVRKRPYSVVLLDEVEKAHRDVMNLFYQVFDRGFMRDGEGREIDFRNTVILMTANLGSDHIMQLLEEKPDATDADLHELLYRQLRQLDALWPDNPQVRALNAQWRKQRELSALSTEALNGYAQAQSQLQRLSAQLDALDERKGRYLTGSELKTAVYGIRQSLKEPPLEELLRQLEEQKQTGEVSPTLLTQIDTRLNQLLNRYVILLDTKVEQSQ